MSNLPNKLKRLHILLNSIARNDTRKIMRELLGITNQALSKKLKELRLKGLVEELQQRPVGIYKLTPLGEQVNQTLIESDHKEMSGFYKCHHLIIGFKILDFGSWKFNETLWKTMKGNWHWQKIRIKDYNIRIQEKTKNRDAGLMAIICPKTYSKTPDEAFDKMVEEAKAVGIQLAQRYGMTLGEYRRVRQGHKELIGSEKIGELIGYWKMGGVWTDASGGGTLRLEEMQDKTEIEQLFAMPKVLDEKLIPAIEKLTEQITLHLAATQEWKDTAKEIRDAIRVLGDKK